ncbi:MAG: hypothetical protein ACI9YH_004200, partial [Colwellia sp.]
AIMQQMKFDSDEEYEEYIKEQIESSK